MKALKIEPTDKTPAITLDAVGNQFEINGRSVPHDAEAFYNPILEWFEEYAQNPNRKTIISFNLEFFNISSSKRILFILYRLNEMIDNGASVVVHWKYSENDDDMLEVGQDYAFMVKVPFEFICTARESVEAVYA